MTVDRATKVYEAEQQIRDIIDAWIDTYLDAIKNDKYLFRSTYHFFNYSEDRELKKKWREFISQDKIRKERERKLYEKYDHLTKFAKSNWLSVVIFRKAKIKDDDWNLHWHICIGAEDYDNKTDTDKYKSSMYVNEMTHPLLYKHILSKNHILNIKSL